MSITLTEPQAPTIDSVTAGNGQISCAFTPPIWDGGDTITEYVAKATPSANTTTCPAGAALGAITITVADITGFNNGDKISVLCNSGTWLERTVTGTPSGTTITLDSALTCTLGSGAGVKKLLTASGASSPIIVTGLTNDIEYTLTVTATNSIGTSVASAASAAATPAAYTLVAEDDPLLVLPEFGYGFEDGEFGSMTPSTFNGADIANVRTNQTNDQAPPNEYVTYVTIGGSHPQTFFTSITIGAVTLNTADADAFVSSPAQWRWDNVLLVPAQATYSVSIV